MMWSAAGDSEWTEMADGDVLTTPSLQELLGSGEGESKQDWKSFAGREGGKAGYQFGDFTRGLVKGAVKEFHETAVPAVRETVTDMKLKALDVKDVFKVSQEKFGKLVVDALDMTEVQALKDSQSSRIARDNYERWWTLAAAEAHKPHEQPSDPLPMASVSPQKETAPPVRGILEVEVLRFSQEQGERLLRPNGHPATNPVCQLALGRRFTGALYPSWEPSAASSSNSKNEETEAPKESMARFTLSESFGTDLRVHVFDATHGWFNVGFEGHAFIGGAIIPLTELIRRSNEHALGSMFEKRFTAVMSINLLPLEYLHDRWKLSTAKERPEKVLSTFGRVHLRYVLTFHDLSPPLLALSTPFSGGTAGNLADTASVDDPLSVILAVGGAVDRVSSGISSMSTYRQAFRRMRSQPAMLSGLLIGWSYTALLAPVAFWPLSAAIFQVTLSVYARRQLRERKEGQWPALYSVDDGGDLSLKERGKQSVRKAIQVELDMLQFAKAFTGFAIQLEKVHYLLTLRDPVLSLIFLSIVAIATFALCAVLFLLSLVLGQHANAFCAWCAGLVFIIPGARSFLLSCFKALLRAKARVFGPDRLLPAIRSWWQRIPDSTEATHLDLFERHVLV